MDLRSTAGNCAWVRTPQLASLSVVGSRAFVRREDSEGCCLIPVRLAKGWRVGPSRVFMLVCARLGFELALLRLTWRGLPVASRRAFEVKSRDVSMAAEFSSARRGAASPKHVERRHAVRCCGSPRRASAAKKTERAIAAKRAEQKQHANKRAHPDLNQGPADLQSAALTTELCTHCGYFPPCRQGIRTPTHAEL